MAYIHLGDCYLDGIGVEKDDREAVKWYCRAEDIEEAGRRTEGFSALERMAKQRKTIEKETLEELAKQGSPSAAFWLAQCYENGTCVKKDENEAVKWYHKAAENAKCDWAFWSLVRLAKNNPRALEALKELAENGKGGVFFIEQCVLGGNLAALEVLKELAEKGDAKAKEAWEEWKDLPKWLEELNAEE